MSRSPVEYLRHILDEVKYLEEQSIELSKEAFLESETLKRAFVRSLEIIGEATKHLSRELCVCSHLSTGTWSCASFDAYRLNAPLLDSEER